jgi:hypothetical protein
VGKGWDGETANARKSVHDGWSDDFSPFDESQGPKIWC